MKLNLVKTKEIVLSLSAVADVPPVFVSGNKIEHVSCGKVLGLTIDTHLSWYHHVQCASSNCRSVLYLLRQLRYYCGYSKDDIAFLISTLLVPRLLYCYPAWCNVGITYRRNIFRVLRSAHKIAGLPFTERDLTHLLENQVSSTFIKALSPKSPLYRLIPARKSHYYNPRTLMPQIQARTTKLLNHFVGSGIRIFNR